MKFNLKIQLLRTPMDYILIKHNHRTSSTRRRWVTKEYLRVRDMFLKFFWKQLMCILSLIDQTPWEQGFFFTLWEACHWFIKKRKIITTKNQSSNQFKNSFIVFNVFPASLKARNGSDGVGRMTIKCSIDKLVKLIKGTFFCQFIGSLKHL